MMNLPVKDHPIDDDFFRLTNIEFLDMKFQISAKPQSPEGDSDSDAQSVLESSHSSSTFADYFKSNICEENNTSSPNRSGSFMRKLEELDESLKQFLEKTSKFASEVNLLEYKSRQLSGKDIPEMDMDLGDNAVSLSCLGYGLFSFICTHLENPDSDNVIGWVNKQKRTFAIHDPTAFAQMWGEEKKKDGMNPKKLYRSLNYLVENKGQMKKTNKKFVYIIANKTERQQHHNEKRRHITVKDGNFPSERKEKSELETPLSNVISKYLVQRTDSNKSTNNNLEASFLRNQFGRNDIPPNPLRNYFKPTQVNTDTFQVNMNFPISTSKSDCNPLSNELPCDLENIEPTFFSETTTPTSPQDENVMSKMLKTYIELF